MGYSYNKITCFRVQNYIQIYKIMLASKLISLSGTRRLLIQSRGHCNPNRPEYRPTWDAAANIPMKYGWVYMAVFMGIWGVGYIANPFRQRDKMMMNYEDKYQK